MMEDEIEMMIRYYAWCYEHNCGVYEIMLPNATFLICRNSIDKLETYVNKIIKFFKDQMKGEKK